MQQFERSLVQCTQLCENPCVAGTKPDERDERDEINSTRKAVTDRYGTAIEARRARGVEQD